VAAEPGRPLLGQHAVVTGGASGIGAAAALELARLGAHLTLIGRRPDKLMAQARAIQEATAVACAPLPLDVTDADAVPAALTRLEAPSILVNNAGAAESAPFSRTGIDLLERMLAVNLKGAFSCTQAVLPAMLAAKYGRIVNIASTAGLKGYAYVTAYCAAKHALVGLTRALAAETAARGVTVNAVCPGYTDTDLARDSIDRVAAKTGRAPDEVLADFVRDAPIGRLIRPEEVAAAVLYLCSAEAAAVTGTTLAVAGGEL
jgi:NAD(P)-dependent dehydrogenase (short-subunit alcohol dehydrogenase family)